MPRQRLTFGNKTDPFYGNFPRKKSLLIAVAAAAAVGEEDQGPWRHFEFRGAEKISGAAT